jgi:hypothetical protein
VDYVVIHELCHSSIITMARNSGSALRGHVLIFRSVKSGSVCMVGRLMFD